MEGFKIAMKVIDEIDKKIKPLIGWEKADEVVKIGADGTPTKRIDIIAENIALNILEKFGGGILISEEIGLKVVGKDLEHIFILDPIDGTYNALKAIPIYSTSIAVAKIKSEDKKLIRENINNLEWIKNFIANNYTIDDLYIGIVKNLATGDLYYAIKGEGSFLEKDGEKIGIEAKDTKDLKEASVGLFVYGLSNDLLEFLKERKVRRVRLFGSMALEMCYVVSGALDAYINVNENSRLCDIAGAYVICKEGNAIITNKNGKPLNMKLHLMERTSLIISNKYLHKKLIALFGNKWAIKPAKFGIVVREDKEDAINLAVEICKYLRDKNIPYCVENFLKNKVGGEPFDISTISHIIAIGGDGTILRASRLVNGETIPIIAVNMGKLGFLAEFYKDEVFRIIDKVIYGEYEIEKRSKLSCKIIKDDKVIKTPSALNEMVVITKNPAKILEFDVYVNDTLVENVRADGIIISTPTGSTAYSLSAGGPIVEPNVDCFIISPICPFKLSSRPLVVSGSNKIKLKLKLEKPALLVIDGSVEYEVGKDDELIFEKSDSYAYFVKGQSFYDKLNRCFGVK
ncbi:ATP-NAD/AcoX kinase [Methanocaldococcus bathoardescens]|uniref:NAD kinase n=1 Tax=Methanocaldococcus bathoardescens TaxID=1301915 RepID=A0A076LHA6_9EURY|nr:bifunctional NADP phosphatase/NAD kinase [Methanocaldococcus bathoardescens]AIJ05833.1 ATP-NAD/AcoX kinase [Methanocaldococcus bathoardescens]